MARFIFSLQVVLNERERQEQLAQRALAEKLRDYDVVEGELRQVEREVTQANDDLRQHQLAPRIDPQFLIAHRRYMGAMRIKIQSIAQRMSTARLAIETARRELGQAVTARKSIEILRDRKLAEFKAEQARKDRVLSDEIGAQIAFANLQ